MKIFLRLVSNVESFFLRPAYARPLAALRIGLSLVLLIQAYMLRFSLLDLFSHDGLLQGDLVDFLTTPDGPRIAWIGKALFPLHLSEAACLYFAGGLYVASLLFLLFGYYTRVAALIAWFLHWTFMVTGETASYGVDLYAHTFLFYLIFVPSGDALSLDLFFGRTKGTPSPLARLGLRVMQLQLCITYLMSAKDKAQGVQWWNGELMWRTFTVPLYRHFDMNWMADWPLLLKAGGWMCLALEGGYFIFIWPRRTRWLWIAGMTGLHAGISIFMGLQLFGLIMCVLTITVFAFSPDPIPVPQAALQAEKKTDRLPVLTAS